MQSGKIVHVNQYLLAGSDWFNTQSKAMPRPQQESKNQTIVAKVSVCCKMHDAGSE